MHFPVAISCLVTLATTVSAQCTKPCHAEYDDATYDSNISMGGPNLIVGLKTTTKANLGILRVEFFTGKRPGAAAVSIWSHDAAGNRPKTMLATGSFTMSAGISWQGANLGKPVPLPANTVFWVGFHPVNGCQSPIRQRGGAGQQPYRGSFDGGKSWNGPFQSYQWKFRLYCCKRNPASYTTFGQACGPRGALPRTGSIGVPTLGKSYQITVSGAQPSAPTFFALGTSDTQWPPYKLPFDLTILGAPGCSLLCSYNVAIQKMTSNSGTATQTITVPNNPWLIGQSIFNQWIVRVPFNSLQLAFSDGGKSTFGL